MFNSLLIANRGEIACRVIRTAKRLGLRTIAVYSDADRNALHVAMADEAIHIGGSAAADSYLDMEKVLKAAKQTGAEAIHPGYGFLSENAAFCRRCDEEGIVFVGPPVGAIEAMGSKSAAKRIMTEAGVPLLPGYHGEDQEEALLRNAAMDIGYPVLLKASAGGGGKGMRIVWSEAEFSDALKAAQREARNAFGDDHMLVEKYLTGPRHVEVQVFCDSLGNGVHLFERDCSLQRRHQKVIEEAPAPGMTEELREAMGSAAVQAAKAISYCGAGTVEFLLADTGEFYFMEMNTRLQVEHPVTELITGQDLVEWQLRVASGLPLPHAQHELKITGHAFEARIYAEDPNNQFLPQTGTLKYLSTPATGKNVRIDSGVVQGDTISVYYDPMIAKLIVWDTDRRSALRRINQALGQYLISGVTTNRRFLQKLVTHEAFVNENFDTGFIEKHHDDLHQYNALDQRNHIAFASLILLQAQSSPSSTDTHSDSPWRSADNWRMNLPATQTLQLECHGESVSVQCQKTGINNYMLEYNGNALSISGYCENGQLHAELEGVKYDLNYYSGAGEYTLFTDTADCHFKLQVNDYEHDGESEGQLTAPMNGTIVSLLVEPGTHVKKGTPLLIMEAMKMEHSLTAPADGIVNSFYYKAGDLVEGGAELLQFEGEEK